MKSTITHIFLFLLVSSIRGWFHGLHWRSSKSSKATWRVLLPQNNVLQASVRNNDFFEMLDDNEDDDGDDGEFDDGGYLSESNFASGKFRGEKSYYPQILGKTETIFLFPALFLQSNDFRKVVFNSLYLHTNRSILIREDLKKHLAYSPHCMLAESPYEENFCMFLQDPYLIDKQVTHMYDWIKRNVDNQTFFSVLENNLPPESSERSKMMAKDLFVLVSQKSHLLKFPLSSLNQNFVGQRLPEDEDVDDVPTSGTKKIGKSSRRKSEMDQEEVSDEESTTHPQPLFVTDDDMFLQEMDDSEIHSSTIL